MTGAGDRWGRTALFAGAAVVLAVLAGLVFASAASLTVTPKNASAFRTCVLTGYPTTSTVVADTWVGQSGPSVNNGTNASVRIRSQSGQNMRAFVRFDLTRCSPALTSTTTVKRATLRLYFTQAPPSTRTYNVARVTSPCPEATATCWTETGVTWSNQPAVAAAATSSFSVPAGSSQQYYGLDVTGDAAVMVAGTVSNYGWRIADSAESAASSFDTQFKAKETANNAAGAPLLVVAYTP